MHVVRAKDGVRFDRIQPAGFVILAAVYAASQEIGIDLWITSGTDLHRAPDPHAEGEAYDVSCVAYPPELVLELKGHLEHTLGPCFTVLYESPYLPHDERLVNIALINHRATAPHLHVQRKKGTIYPPPELTGRLA